MEQKQMEPGPRQTIDRAVMPGGIGPGQLVWKNGPAFFVPDEGPIVQLHKVDWGGASSEPKRSWNRVWLTPKEMVEADVLAHGDDHSRWFSPLFGDGWLVSERDLNARDEKGHRQLFERFEDMEGNLKVRFEMIELCVGRPAYREKMQKKHSKMPPIDDPDEMSWVTHRSRDGSIFTFRRGGPPPPEGTFIRVDDRTYRDFTPKARKAYDAAKKAHDAGGVVATQAVAKEQLSLPIGSER